MNLLLCAASLLFYAFGRLAYLPLLLASAVLNWLLGLVIACGKRARGVCALGVALNLALLGVFKYLGFSSGRLYYIGEDGLCLRNTDLETLRFGADGCYTSGYFFDPELEYASLRDGGLLYAMFKLPWSSATARWDYTYNMEIEGFPPKPAS